MMLPATAYKIEGYADQALGFSEAFICLYMPILGSEASMLYQYMLIERGRSGTHHRFMQHFGWSLSYFQKLREKLEAMQLVKTYASEDEVYVYVLKAPLAYTQFFGHGLFSSLLLKTVGNAHYEELQKRYDFDFSEHQNMTQSFADVFGKVEPQQLKKEASQSSVQEQFDWELFDALVAKSFIRMKTIEANRELIASKAYIFQKSIEEMARIVLESYNVNAHEINRSKMEHMLMEPVQAKKLRAKKNRSDEAQTDQITTFFETTSPQDFLKARFGHVSKNDLKIIDMCMGEFQFSRGVTNVLIDYVLYTNDQKLTKAYVETIASQMYRKKITTASDAMRHFTMVKEGQKKAPKQTNRYQKQTAPKAHQEMVDFDAIETKAPLSDDEFNKFLEEYGDVLNADVE